jgi:hypothetical protein
MLEKQLGLEETKIEELKPVKKGFEVTGQSFFNQN